MPTRERWIVYPLLFLSIGLAMRSGLIQTEQEKLIVTDLVKCKAFEVVDEDNNPRVIIGSDDEKNGGSYVALLHGSGKDVLVLKNENPARIFEGPLDRKGNARPKRMVMFYDPLNPFGDRPSTRGNPPKVSPAPRANPAPKAKPPVPKQDTDENEKAAD